MGVEGLAFSVIYAASGTTLQSVTSPYFYTLGWYPEVHRAIFSIASGIASRAIVEFSRARSILFQRYAALLVTNNGVCLPSGGGGNA